MNITQLLSRLKSLGIRLRVEGERLRYEAPLDALTPELRAELNQNKVELLAYLQESIRTIASGLSHIEPIDRDGFLPLSFAQQRLWLLDQLGTGSAYNIRRAVHIAGSLNVDSLQLSLNELIRRHESLRTTFTNVDGRRTQVIAEHGSVDIQVIDLSTQPKGRRETEARCLAVKESQLPFNLTRGPLLRVHLFRLSEDNHILLITMHHIVSDGWSMGVFTREMAALYEAYCNGKSSPLPDLPIQYADFAHWQREWLKGDVLESQLSYWRKQLDRIPVLQLPTDYPRPAVQTFEGASQPLVISQPLTTALKELSQREGATLFMTLLAAFNVLLYRYTGQDDIVVGSPIANRNRAETEGMIGFFVNSLAMRTDLKGNPGFRELLGRVREAALGAYAHQDLPFEKLVEELQPERDLSQNPLFQVMFVLHNAPKEVLELPGLTLNQIDLDVTVTHFDIEFHVWDNIDGLSGMVLYNTELFDADTIVRMLRHYETLLMGIVAVPDQRISDLPFLTDAERHQLIIEWNNTRTNFPHESYLQELFEARVEEHPDAVAVEFDDEHVTYRDLNRRANQLAHHLHALGVGPDVTVGICMNRSIEMLVALLGIFKAGGSYVPLDPAYPRERLAFMLEDAHAPVLLTQEQLVKTLPSNTLTILCLDTESETISRKSTVNPDVRVTAESLAYVIYTSGSTGKPKGVGMNHGPLHNLILWQLRSSPLNKGARTLQFSSLSFDVSFQEIFSTWLSGGSLVLISEERRKNTDGLLRIIEEKSVKRLFLPFVALQQLAELANSSNILPASLREMITAGEQLQITRPISGWFKKLTNCTLYNQYGPSECHVVTAFPLTEHPADWPALPPIGRPIANTQIYILDFGMQPVPVGIPGDLYIGGNCLARGYLNRPELTAEKFVPDPFSRIPGARLYKTGDRARYLTDGNIEFLGRLDHQVKIRGFRIELGEIEAVCGQHQSVQEAVVLAWEDVPGEKRLVAYIVFNRKQKASTVELRGFLKERLPDYMVPVSFIPMDELPLTPSGKVDRRALPAPEGIRPELEVEYAVPATEVERKIAVIWKDALHIDEVGIHDNFFDLGGHSLLMASVFGRLKEDFKNTLSISMIDLFKYPTISSLAKYLSQGKNGHPSDPHHEDLDRKLNEGKHRLTQLYKRRRH